MELGPFRRHFAFFFFITKNCLPTHSECDLFDKSELELDCMQQKTTECVPLV